MAYEFSYGANLHAAFRQVGIYEKHGKLDGVWRDVVIVEKTIPANWK